MEKVIQNVQGQELGQLEGQQSKGAGNTKCG